jgi:hypothetical protein
MCDCGSLDQCQDVIRQGHIRDCVTDKCDGSGIASADAGPFDAAVQIAVQMLQSRLGGFKIQSENTFCRRCREEGDTQIPFLNSL